MSTQNLDIIKEEKEKDIESKPKSHKFMRQNNVANEDVLQIISHNRMNSFKALYDKKLKFNKQNSETYQDEESEIETENEKDRRNRDALGRSKKIKPKKFMRSSINKKSQSQKSNKKIIVSEHYEVDENNNRHSSSSIFKRRSKDKTMGTMVNIDPVEIKSVFNMNRKLVDIKRPSASNLFSLSELIHLKMSNADFVKNFIFSYEIIS